MTSKATRVIVVWGSETNQTQNFMNHVVTDWKETAAQNIEVVKIIEGNKASKEFEEITVENYDMIVVGTSSYGDGDAPSGFGKFLYRLYEAAKAGEKPFQGMQHTVIGFGSTYYETFQNCPRIVDKLLGETGSTRVLERVEVDEMSEDDLDEQVKKWADSVVKVCTANTTIKDPVCDWKVPKEEIFHKNLGPDGFEVGDGLQDSSTRMAIAGAVGLAGAVFYYYYIMGASEEVASA